MLLLPQPKSVKSISGHFTLANDTKVVVPTNIEEPERVALGRLVDYCSSKLDRRIAVVSAADSDGGATDGKLVLRIKPSGKTPCEKQAYRLTIKPDGVEVVGSSNEGLLYGIQTLRQLAVVHKTNWPCAEIVDVPDYEIRGFYHDVSRGKVPKLETIKHIIDTLWELKVNHFQLYVEHTYDFKFNPNISKDCSPLTADEIRELDEYCRERRIDFVPSLASFGHMGRVLGLPEYRHLADVETDKTWAERTWHQRMRGLTLDCVNPEARKLIEQMYAEYLPLFSSDWMNVCCDETYDLGRGKNKERAEEVGTGRLFVEYIKWLHALCKKHNRKMMMWADIVLHHPDLISEIPHDVVMLNWIYSPNGKFDETTDTLRKAGFDVYVCPACWGWNRLVNRITNYAEPNIRKFAAAGKRHGAIGLLNTDWGDDGHVNMLAGSWYPMVLGAAMGWNIDGPNTEDFCAAITVQWFGAGNDQMVAALRKVSDAGDVASTWPMFYKPFSEFPDAETAPAEKLDEMARACLEAADVFAGYKSDDKQAMQDASELEIACRVKALVAERFSLSRELAISSEKAADLGDRLEAFARNCEQLAGQYEKVWMVRNKPSMVHEIKTVLHRLAKEARAAK